MNRMSRLLLPALACAVAFAMATPSRVVVAGYTVEGKVTAVSDGDTATVLDAENVQHKIRFAGIDAPEKKQAHGMDAKQALSKMIFGKSVVVNVANRDLYGREVGSVLVDGIDVNGSMVRWGWAWCYREYKHPKEYETYEDEAREKQRGLWADKRPIRPSEFRKGKR